MTILTLIPRLYSIMMTASERRDSSGDILIIDDTPDNLRFLSDLLAKAGYSVRKVITGELGLEAARLEPPDLILLDIMMPGVNGYEICERLKMGERTQHIPVLFLSALDEELDKVQAFQIGGVDYITKPFQIVEVLARIETHLKLSRLQHQLQQRNEQLQHEIEYRSAAETALQLLNQGLDARVQERTAELTQKNRYLLDVQRDLQKALVQERRLGELKSRLVTTLTQELRTPMTVMQTALELLQLDALKSSAAQRYVQMIAESIQQMQRSLQDTLFTELDHPSKSFQLAPLELAEVCQAFLNQWALPETPDYHLSFVSWGKPAGTIAADSALLHQLLAHLVDNAIRYTPQGGTILLELVYEPTHAVIRVQDEGIGIPADEIDRIFDRFYRASNTDLLPDKSGNGLGLTLAKQIVGQHAGTITVSSESNKGSIFSIRLPYQPAAPAS
jgi:two-component system, sensor histidine kinase and response regulator